MRSSLFYLWTKVLNVSPATQRVSGLNWNLHLQPWKDSVPWFLFASNTSSCVFSCSEILLELREALDDNLVVS